MLTIVLYKESKSFKMLNGDSVYIYPLDDSANSSINLYGNIIRPGSYNIENDSTLKTFFTKNTKNGIKNFFLPETYFEYGVVKHYTKELIYEMKSFNISNVLNGLEDVSLAPNDELFIFNKNDISNSAYITTVGDVLITEGKLQYFKGMTIRDAIHASGVAGIVDDKIRITTINTINRMPKTIFYSLKNEGNIVLSEYDEIEVYDYYKTHLLEPISIKGEIINPTTVFFEPGIVLSQLFDISGGLTPMAFQNRVEIVRYFIDSDFSRKKRIINLDLRETNIEEYKLEPYDEVTVFKIPDWGESKSVVLQGEVRFPGTYTISSGEKLGSVIQRAGGYTSEAFVEGAVFTRKSIQDNQVKQYRRSLARIKRELAIYNAMPANSKQATGIEQTNMLNEVILDAQKYEPIGRVSILLDKNVTKFMQSQFNLVLKDQDTIRIPTFVDTITVFGEVFNPTSFVYYEGITIDEYISLASGLTKAADMDSIYIIRADGTSEPIENGWFSASVEVKKGDTIVVPIFIKENNALDIWNSVAKVLSSFALTAAAINSLGVL